MVSLFFGLMPPWPPEVQLDVAAGHDAVALLDVHDGRGQVVTREAALATISRVGRIGVA